MTVTTMEILGRDGAFHPTLGISRASRDALAEYTRLRWPTGRRKAIEREWGLTSDQARSVMEANASATTIDRIWKHPNGGWRVLLPVMGAVVGQPVHEFFREEIRKAAREQEALEHHAALAAAARGRLALRRGGVGLAAGPDRDGRQDRDEAGNLGDEEARRLG